MSTAPHPSLSQLPQDPLELFTEWYRRAESVPTLRYPGAMCLSTVSPEGRPQGRTVLVHGFDAAGFLFATDVRSAKARALATTPLAALTVYWGDPLELQVRIEGPVEEAPPAIADAIYRKRPRRSQATPWASCQSEVTTLDELEARLAEVEHRWRDAQELPRPETWRAYRLVPETMEFWVARERRLHDRFLYTRRGGSWERARLAP